MPSTAERTVATCSFCGKSNTAVGRLVAGPGVFICNECVALSAELIATEPPRPLPHLAPWEADLPLDQVLAGLAPVARAEAQASRNLHAWVLKARDLGATWAQVGEALGVTRQSAWERFSAQGRAPS